MILDYFSGIRFSMAGAFKDYRKTIANQPLYYGVQYNLEGKLWLRVDRTYEYTVEGPWAFITHPGAFFEYGPVDGESRLHSYVCFYGPRVQDYIKGGLLPIRAESHPIKINHHERFMQSMRKIINIIFDKTISLERSVLTLEDLLLQLHEQERGTPLPRAHQTPYFSALMSEIRFHPEYDWNFAKAASELNVSPVHFRRLFKQYCGLAPQQFLIRQRMLKGAEMLINTAELVRTIATAVGIENEFYFSRLFKKTYNLSPERYRREFAGTEL